MILERVTVRGGSSGRLQVGVFKGTWRGGLKASAFLGGGGGLKKIFKGFDLRLFWRGSE